MRNNMSKSPSEVGILKCLWRRRENGDWAIHDLKGLTLKPQAGFESDFFKFESQMELMTQSPGTRNVHEFFTSFGPTDFLLKQSILPVVAWVAGEGSIRCIGTAFVVSCTGFIFTACHVLLDPQDRSYGKVRRDGNVLSFMDGLKMGVLMPLSPAYGQTGFRFFGFEQSWYWGKWRASPLIHENEKFEILTDIAVCKISAMPDGTAHQPLNLSLNPFTKGEKAYALGYAQMEDIPLELRNGQVIVPDFKQDLYVSVGEAMDVFADNLQRKEVPTPGPCFDFRAKIPGKMSGGPIFGGDGSVVRGVISRSFSGEKHAYGAMLGPVMHLPLIEGMSLKNLMDSGNEGIANIQGAGL